MITSSLIGLLCGAGLAFRFKVGVLLPSHAVAILVTLVLAMLRQTSVLEAGADFVCWSLGLQAGYAAVACLAGSARTASRAMHGLSRP